MTVKPAEVLAKVLRSYLDNKRFLALLAIGTGGVATVAASQLAALRTQSKSDRAASAAVLKGRADSHKRTGPKPPAVDRVFLERLLFVLRIAVPSWHSQEAFMLATQSVVLVSRSLLSLRMARIGGNGLKARPGGPAQRSAAQRRAVRLASGLASRASRAWLRAGGCASPGPSRCVSTGVSRASRARAGRGAARVAASAALRQRWLP